MQPTHWALNLHHCESSGKWGVTLLPERWGQQSNFFSKFLGRDSKAELMELSVAATQLQLQNSPDPWSFFFWKKMAVMQPWILFCTNMSFPLAFLKKPKPDLDQLGRYLTPIGEILQLARLVSVFEHTRGQTASTDKSLFANVLMLLSVPSSPRCVFGGLGLKQVGFWAALFSWSLYYWAYLLRTDFRKDPKADKQQLMEF